MSVIQSSKPVLKHASDLADGVLSGSVSLDSAYQTAKERKNSASSDEAHLDTLRKRYPVYGGNSQK
ncbi:MAG: hypothetical protein V3V61_03735 [Gammaproteobacteria bacterium]